MENYELLKDFKHFKSTMKQEERMKKYLGGEKVDHQPYGLITNVFTLATVYGYTTRQANENIDIYLEIVERGHEDGYLQGLSIGLTLRTIGAAMGSTLNFPENGIEYIETYLLEDYGNWDKLIDPDPYNNPILTPMLELASKVKERLPWVNLTSGVCGPISTAVALRPIEKVLKDTRKNPNQLKELIHIVTDASLRWIRAFTNEFGTSAMSIGDPVACNDILSLRQFEEFNLGELKRMISEMKEITGFKPSLHICGHSKKLWPYFKELGISAFSVDNCEDIGELVDAVGDYIMVVGNVPPVDVLWRGTPKEIINSVKDCIKKGSVAKKGFLISSGCGLPVGTKKENLDVYIYAIRKYGSGARIGELPTGMTNL